MVEGRAIVADPVVAEIVWPDAVRSVRSSLNLVGSGWEPSTSYWIWDRPMNDLQRTGDPCVLYFRTLRSWATVGLTLLLYAFAISVAMGCQQDRETPETDGAAQSNVRLAGKFRQLAVVQDDRLTEISGIAAASRAGCVWVLNDSGGKNELYLLDDQGVCQQTLVVDGAKARDWEALSRVVRAGVTSLLIGDTGNNQLKQQWLHFYLVTEPQLGGETQKATVSQKIKLLFPDRRRDCEAVAYCGGYVYLATKASALDKEQTQSQFFRFPLPTVDGEHELVAEALGPAPLPLATGMDISDDGLTMVVRDYFLMAVYQRAPDQSWESRLKQKPTLRFAGPLQKQAEAVCFSVEGGKLWTISEGRHPAWWSVDLERGTDEQ